MPHDSVIAKHPPNDGRDWDCQCARCGSSMDWHYCGNCDDGVVGHDCGEDTCMCLHPEENVVCGICCGKGGWYTCLSTAEYCEAHPVKGRTNRRGEIEWFTFDDLPARADDKPRRSRGPSP